MNVLFEPPNAEQDEGVAAGVTPRSIDEPADIGRVQPGISGSGSADGHSSFPSSKLCD